MVFHGTVKMWKDVVENAHFLKCTLQKAVTHVAKENSGWLPKQDSWWVSLCYWSCVIGSPVVEWSPKELTGEEAGKDFDLTSFSPLSQNYPKCTKVQGVLRYALPQPKQGLGEPETRGSLIWFSQCTWQIPPHFFCGMRWKKMWHTELISKRESEMYIYSERMNLRV